MGQLQEALRCLRETKDPCNPRRVKMSKRTVRVQNVSTSANENELKVFFRFHGDIIQIRQLHKGEGGDQGSTYLVEYKESKEAESALLFDRTSFYSSPIRVELSRETIEEFDKANQPRVAEERALPTSNVTSTPTPPAPSPMATAPSPPPRSVPSPAIRRQAAPDTSSTKVVSDAQSDSMYSGIKWLSPFEPFPAAM